jgi:hypothetical protein
LWLLDMQNQVNMIKLKIVAFGIIDFIIDLLRSKEHDKIEKYSILINNFLSRWISSFESGY